MIGILSLGIAKDKPFTLTLDGEDEDIFYLNLRSY
jgi:phosphotransferase system HPr-like phosphotransfer protein